jgi:hypothetical protein
MTTELCDDLINFSFDNLHDVFENYQTHIPTSRFTIHHFVPPFLECLKKLVCYHSTLAFSAYCIYTFYTVAIIWSRPYLPVSSSSLRQDALQ